MKSLPFALGLTALSAATAGVVSLVTVQYAQPIAEPSPATEASRPTIGTARDHIAAESPIVRTVSQAKDSVVSVIVTKDVPKMERYFESLPFSNDPFDGFFGMPFNFQMPRMRQNGTERREVGGGTAFFVTGDGLLLTNKHVVDDPDAEYTVFLNDGRKLQAKVAGRDPTNDVALLKVEGTGFVPLELAVTDEPILGETVVAIGNALGEFRNTVSVGVISGLRRSIVAGGMGAQREQLSSIIQTDAAINQGNSGGPLLDLEGKVVGMNTAVAGGAQNIAFAIPAGDLRRSLQSYQTNGRIVRPYLGVRFAPIDEAMKNANKLETDTGVIVVRGEARTELAVVPGSPADKAGLRENDIIVEVDGQVIDSEHPLNALVQRRQPGDRITLTIIRQGKRQNVTVTLDEWKE